jgi:hypothetical protein
MINWLTLFKQITSVYCENRTKHINTKWRVIDCWSRWDINYHWALKGKETAAALPQCCSTTARISCNGWSLIILLSIRGADPVTGITWYGVSLTEHVSSDTLLMFIPLQWCFHEKKMQVKRKVSSVALQMQRCQCRITEREENGREGDRRDLHTKF